MSVSMSVSVRLCVCGVCVSVAVSVFVCLLVSSSVCSQMKVKIYSGIPFIFICTDICSNNGFQKIPPRVVEVVESDTCRILNIRVAWSDTVLLGYIFG